MMKTQLIPYTSRTTLTTSSLFALSLIWIFIGITTNAISQQKQSSSNLGSFEGQTDIGTTPIKGGVKYDPASGEYTVTGGGGDIFGTSDAFHYLWRRLPGDVTLTADVHFLGTSAAHHRKAVLMIRQSLEPDAVYVDAALHGSGLTALQYRQTASAKTLSIRSPENAPTQIRLERRGNQFTMYVGKPGEKLVATGPVSVNLQGPVYVGLGVSSHNAETVETAVFSNVTIKLAQVGQNALNPTHVRSNVSIYDIRDKSVHVIYTANTLFEAPNWSPDGKYLLVNSHGSRPAFPVQSGDPTRPEAWGRARQCSSVPLLADECVPASCFHWQSRLSPWQWPFVKAHWHVESATHLRAPGRELRWQP